MKKKAMMFFAILGQLLYDPGSRQNTLAQKDIIASDKVLFSTKMYLYFFYSSIKIYVVDTH